MSKKIELRRKNASGFTDDDLLYVRASWNHLDDKPGTFVPSSHSHDPDDIEPGSNGQVLKTVSGVTAWATDETGSNNYVDGVSGNGDGTLTLTRSGLSNLSVNLAHSHNEYSLSEGLVNTYKASGGTGNDPDTVMILCPYTASQNVLGTVFIERTSGHRGATQIDILYSSGSTQGNTSQSLRVHQTDYYPGEFSLVVRDVDGTDYVCLRRESINGNYFQTKSWFTGFTTYTGSRFADWLVTPSGGSTLPLTGRTQLHGSTKIDDNEVYHEGHKPTWDEVTGKPTDVSHFNNDAGYITSYPVDEVNGQTGSVVLDAADVGALSEVDLGKTVASTYINITNTGGNNVMLEQATDSNAGLMSASDHAKLDGIDENAEENTVDTVNGQTGAVNIDNEELRVTYERSSNIDISDYNHGDTILMTSSYTRDVTLDSNSHPTGTIINIILTGVGNVHIIEGDDSLGWNDGSGYHSGDCQIDGRGRAVSLIRTQYVNHWMAVGAVTEI